MAKELIDPKIAPALCFVIAYGIVLVGAICWVIGEGRRINKK